MNGGFIKIERSLARRLRELPDESYGVYMRLLEKVNWQPKRWKTIVVQPGQMVYARRLLAERLYGDNPAPAYNTIRKRLDELKEHGLIEIESNARYTLLTLTDFGSKSEPKSGSESEPNLEPKSEPKSEPDRRRKKKDKKDSLFLEIPRILKTEKFEDAWSQWLQHLREKKTRTTPSALRKQLAKCESMGAARAIAAIEHSIAGSYQGIFEPASRSTPDTDTRQYRRA